MVSATKALPWSMSIQPRFSRMSMATGVDAGSMLVPELVWLSSTSMRVVGGFVMFIGDVGAFGGAGAFIPGMSGMGLSCAPMMACC